MFTQGTLLRRLSLNVARMNNPLKRRRICNFLKQQGICLQERHLRVQEEKYLKDYFKRVLFHAAATIKQRGVCIGLTHKLNWYSKAGYKD